MKISKYLLTVCFCICFSLLSLNVFGNERVVEEEKVVDVQENPNSVNKWDYFMYPIPASSDLNIRITRGNVSISEVVVTNKAGEEVLVIKDKDISKLKLDVSDLDAGEYFVRIITNEYSLPKMKRIFVSK